MGSRQLSEDSPHFVVARPALGELLEYGVVVDGLEGGETEAGSADELGVSCLQHHVCGGRLSVDCLEALGESLS